jgi:AbrB family looped-hinge helix DNA binding protein
MTGKMEVRPKRQITLPKSLTDFLKIEAGDILEYEIADGKIIITPKMLIPKDQAWYWTKKWQQDEAEVEEEIRTKGYGKDYTIDELIGELDDAQN